ncbi:6-pyruvoyl trahydropterin synthase family protein [Humitalea sp. 24SJ18S-53]|uniref:6-pyruvoyl trahydropterin synthase family protein n=1 Tax=Humitalea sp. 24SJ18S-53 TaxID=3422307 RepID=UPI003D672280
MFQEFAFEAAHKTTPDTPLHGHTFKVKVVLTGEPVPVFGWSHDLLVVEPIISALRKQLDHRYLNDIEGLETPSLENVAQWIFRRLDKEIPGVDRVEVRRGLEGACDGVVYREASRVHA